MFLTFLLECVCVKARFWKVVCNHREGIYLIKHIFTQTLSKTFSTDILLIQPTFEAFY